MIRIHCSDHDDADTAWRMLTHVPDADLQPVELHLDGHGLLYTITRDPNGQQTSVPSAAPVARTPPP
jgi:hypothetical protein